MIATTLIKAVLAAAASFAATSQAAAVPRQTDAGRLVFAHYMVGVTDGQTLDKWKADIASAKAAGVDGFALNAGAADAYNDEQLPLAYEAAGATEGGFQLFISFDQAASTWDVAGVVARVNQFKDDASQFRIGGVPVVSTFEGTDWADNSGNWAAVRDQTGGIYLIPDWSSFGPDKIAEKLDVIDGAFNWGAWPSANSDTLTSDTDKSYQTVLGDKSYMMGVSPYFYTNINGDGWSKNWYSSSDSLWFDRWKQVLEVVPSYVELITWNDYGESSYLNSPAASVGQIYPGAEAYVEGFDHTAFQFVLPYFISAYKAGNTDVPIPTEGAVAWYRTTPKAACSDGGTVWGQDGSQSATLGTQDVISVIALSSAAADITVSVGDASETVSPIDSVGAAYYYEVSFEGKTGAVTVTLGDKSTTGPDISNNCPASGVVNFNSVAIQL